MAKVQPIPEGYEHSTPYICCDGVAKAIDWYKKAFGAEELFRIAGPGDKVMHAEVKISGAIIMMSEPMPQMQFVSPKSLNGTSVSIYIYVNDVDAFTKRAEAAGAKILRPPADQFYGDRSVGIECPWGHRWGFATHIEDVTPEEVTRRAREKFAAGG